ncbi:MAG: insulinase family protein [Myxococcota bacterium]|nr:insulinase family protein [Myxococcota bacterium]
MGRPSYASLVQPSEEVTESRVGRWVLGHRSNCPSGPPQPTLPTLLRFALGLGNFATMTRRNDRQIALIVGTLCITSILMGCGGRLFFDPSPPGQSIERRALLIENDGQIQVDGTLEGPISVVQFRFPAGLIHESADERGAAAAALAHLIGRPGLDLEGQMLGRGVQLTAWIEPNSAVLSLAGERDALRQALVDFTHAFQGQTWHSITTQSPRAVSSVTPLQRLLRLSYGGHAYGHHSVPPAQQPEAATISAFGRRTYGREGMKVIVVTGAKSERLITVLRQAISSIPDGWAPNRQSDPPNVATSVTFDTNRDQTSDILLAFPVRIETVESAALADVASRTLADGSLGRLGRIAASSTSSIRHARAFISSPGPESRLVIQVGAGPQQLDDAWQTLFGVLSALKTTPITSEEVVQASETLANQLALIDGDPKNRARHLGGLACRWSDGLAARQQWRNAREALRAAQVQQWWKTVLDLKAMTVLIQSPPNRELPDIRLYGESLVEQARRIMNPRPIVGDRGLTEFQPGVRLGLYPQQGTNTVSVAVRAWGGQRAETSALAGMSAIVSQALREHFNRHRVLVKSDPIGITLVASYTRAQFSRRLETLLRGLMTATLRPSQIEHARVLARSDLSELARSDDFRSEEQTIGSLERARGHFHLDVNARLKNLDEISVPQVNAWFRAHVSDAAKDIVIVGDFDESETRRILERGMSRAVLGPPMQTRLTTALDQAPSVHGAQNTVGAQSARIYGSAWSVLVWPRYRGADVEGLGLFEYIVNRKLSPSPNHVHRPQDKSWVRVSILADRVVVRFRQPPKMPTAVLDVVKALAATPMDSADFIELRDIYVRSQVIALSDARALARWLLNQLRFPHAWTGPGAFEDWRAFMDGLSVEDLGKIARLFVTTYDNRYGASSINGEAARTLKSEANK